jgi:Spy/CpxP family protein refolding chaperone
MTKKRWILALVLVVLVVGGFSLLSCAGRHSADGMALGRMYRMNRVFDELGLTEDQRVALKQLFVEHRKDLQPSVGEVKARGKVLKELIMAETPDEAAIRKASVDLGSAIAEASVQISALAKEVRLILTPEQVEKAKELRQRRQQVFHETLRDWGDRGSEF